MTDLHRKKAAEIFGIPEDQVTPEQRRFGKLANYHAMYGISQPLINTVGTTTGRISSAQPAIANLPTGSAEARRVREAFAYIPDAVRLAQPMGQFQNWHDKLFRWSGDFLGWRYVKGLL